MKMENNWKETIEKMLVDVKDSKKLTKSEYKDLIDRFLVFGNLVFEATKKECADKAKVNTIADKGGYVYGELNEDSILNIQKPNL